MIAKYEVTQTEYEAVMTDHATLSATPSLHSGDSLPVERVSRDDLKEADGFLARTGLELPSEAQWEYACRAGTTTRFAYGATLDSASEANFNGLDTVNDFPIGCSDATGNTKRESTIDVGSLLPNAFGLFDMHGNVAELVEGQDVANPTSALLRGGFFVSEARGCRSASRAISPPDSRSGVVGFRPAMPLP